MTRPARAGGAAAPAGAGPGIPSEPSPPSWRRRALWLALAGAWTFLFLALATSSSADWPSRSVAIHNEPASNVLGRAGALAAHWIFTAMGPGTWVAMVAFAWMLGVLASGRVVSHPLVRLIGIVLMSLCASALVGWWMPSLSPVVGAEGGVLPALVFDELARRFPDLMIAVLLLTGFLVGAVVAMDELVFAFPAMVGRTLAVFDPILQFEWRRLVPGSRRRALALSGVSGMSGMSGMSGFVARRSTHGGHRSDGPGAAVVVSPALNANKLSRRKMSDRDLEVAETQAREWEGASLLDEARGDHGVGEDAEGLAGTDAPEREILRSIADRFDDDGEGHDDALAETGDSYDARGTRARAVAPADAEDEEDELEDAEESAADDESDGPIDAHDADASDDADPAEASADRDDRGDATAETETVAVPSRQLTPEELRERIGKLPVRMANRKVETAREEDIPRAVDYSGYQFPGLDMLEDSEGNFSETMEAFVREQAQVLTEALRTYQIDGEVTGIESGPVVTLYSVELAPGTRVARLETISKDIARSLQAPNIRIIPNMVGRTAVGIEVPNRQKERVRLKELMSGGHAQNMILPMFLGKDSAGEPLVADLCRMPHMLIAGTTGSGKSVCMNTIIMGWLYTKRPDELKLVLVDPKMVEMSQFADIPHLMCPVVTDMSKAAGILEWATEKMEERYELLKDAGVRDIRSYNELGEEELYQRFNPQNDLERAKIPKKLPYLVFVIDELADLMMTNKEVEHSIVRIAQKARAVGIHLIVATQRPQANVVTGLIKSNMPCRISFKVASGMDSRIVLDQKGAELLLGQGDMLVLTPSSSELRRAQGTLVTDGETRSVARFLKNVAAPSFERQLLAIRGPGARSSGDSDNGDAGDPGADERDPLFDKAVEVMIDSGRGSVSLLQRRLAIGYGRASRLVDQMGLAGILSDHKGSVAREVLITAEDWSRMKAMEAEDAATTELLGAKPPTGTRESTMGASPSGVARESTAGSPIAGATADVDESEESETASTGDTPDSDLEYVDDDESDGPVPDEMPDEYRQ